MQINIADDYYKTILKIKELETENEVKGNEIFDLKHEVISTQTKLETAQKEMEELKREIYEAQKKIVRLETELSENEKKNRI
jgi:cell division protein ZapA